MKKLFYSFLLCCVVFYQEAPAQENQLAVEASLVITPDQEGFSKYEAILLNKSLFTVNIKYKFSIVYPVTGGASAVREDLESYVVINSSEKQTLDTHIVNVSDGKRKIVLLVIYDLENNVIATARAVVNDDVGVKVRDLRPRAKREDSTAIPATLKISESNLEDTSSDGFVLRNLVVQETKTKLGNDFYQSFYLAYLNKKINGERVVKVREAFALGRNTKIEVFVDQELVWQFFMRPNPEYLKEMEKYALDRVNKYFLRLRSNKKKQLY